MTDTMLEGDYGMHKRVVHFFDIDGTITNETEGWDYISRTPRKDVIKKIQSIHKLKHPIILWTSRLEIDRYITVKWLKKFDVPYNRIIFDKPTWDLYVCDKSINIEHWMEE